MCMTPDQRQGDNETFLESARKESLVFFLSKLNTLWYQKHRQQIAKEKNWQIWFHKNLKILYIKRHYQQNEKVTHRMGKNVCKSYTDEGLISRI